MDLTFSIEYTVTNPIALVEEWTIELIEKQLEEANSSCTSDGNENNDDCPYEYSLSVSLIDTGKNSVCLFVFFSLVVVMAYMI